MGDWLEGGMEAAMRNFSREGHRFIFSAIIFRLYFFCSRGVTDTWDVLQHEVSEGSISSNSKLSKGESNINSYV